MIVISPGIRVLGYVPINMPGIDGWQSRYGTVTRVDHPDRRCVYVLWDGTDREEGEFMGGLEPLDYSDRTGKPQGARIDQNGMTFLERAIYLRRMCGERPPGVTDAVVDVPPADLW